jgi:dimethylamine monooxygenase subunit C
MLVQGIKSRPVYTGLTIDPNARRHLFAIEGEGASALTDQVLEANNVFLKTADVLYVSTGSSHLASIAAMRPKYHWAAPTLPALLTRLRVELSHAKMGTRLYVAGTEGFIGQAMQVAIDLSIDFNSIRTEHRGSLARRVQCVHCKGITNDVKTSPYICIHCGLLLLVRDHYSRRIAAFQGVCICAEDSAICPTPEEMFP